MPWWLAPAITGAGQIAGKVFGGDEGGLSPEMQRLLDRVETMYAEGLPEGIRGRISAPYIQERQRIEKSYARQPGVSGLQSAQIQRRVTGPMGQAIGGAETQYQTRLLDVIAQITGQTRPRPGWGQTIGGVGGMFGQAYGEKEEWDEIMGILGKIYPDLLGETDEGVG